MSNLNLLTKNTSQQTKIYTTNVKNEKLEVDATLTGDTQILTTDIQNNTTNLLTLTPELKINKIMYKTGKVAVTVSPTFNISLFAPQIYELYYQQIGNIVYTWGTLNSLNAPSGTSIAYTVSLPVPRYNFANKGGGFVAGDLGFGQCVVDLNLIMVRYRTRYSSISKHFIYCIYPL